MQGAYVRRARNNVFDFGPLGEWVTLGGKDVQQMRITYWGPGGKSGREQQSGQIGKEGLCWELWSGWDCLGVDCRGVGARGRHIRDQEGSQWGRRRGCIGSWRRMKGRRGQPRGSDFTPNTELELLGERNKKMDFSWRDVLFGLEVAQATYPLAPLWLWYTHAHLKTSDSVGLGHGLKARVSSKLPGMLMLLVLKTRLEKQETTAVLLRVWS